MLNTPRPSHKHRRLFWAPGGYICRCKCGEEFIGDKRATMCPTCAYDPMVILAMNGPPGSGKDYLANRIREFLEDHEVNTVSLTFADPIHAELEQKYPLWKDIWTVEQKNSPCDQLGGRTPRSVLIEYATALREQDDYIFLRKTVEQAEARRADVCILTDLGYEHERKFLESYAGQVIIVSVSAEGCDYVQDNRSRQLISGKTILHDNVKGDEDQVQKLLHAISESIWKGGRLGW